MCHQNLSLGELKQGLITCSSGNAAIALALAARDIGAQKGLKIAVIAVLPTSSSEIKMNMLKEHGVEVIIHGDSMSDADKLAE